MRHKKLSKLFKDEIESLLVPLSDTPDLSNIVNETLVQYINDLAIEGKSARPWSLLPLMVCEAISTHYEHVVPFAVSLQFFRAAADILDDVEDADSLKSLKTFIAFLKASLLSLLFLDKRLHVLINFFSMVSQPEE